MNALQGEILLGRGYIKWCKRGLSRSYFYAFEDIVLLLGTLKQRPESQKELYDRGDNQITDFFVSFPWILEVFRSEILG